jgi:hypothetical protein
MFIRQSPKRVSKRLKLEVPYATLTCVYLEVLTLLNCFLALLET